MPAKTKATTKDLTTTQDLTGLQRTPVRRPVRSDATEDDRLDLRPELAVVRQIMRRLVALWDRQGEAIESEEARRLAALIFNGARTAAILLFQETRRASADKGKDGIEDWLAAALDELGEKYGTEL
jgi:hypothetical protein